MTLDQLLIKTGYDKEKMTIGEYLLAKKIFSEMVGVLNRLPLCECNGWARAGIVDVETENSHHPRCKKYKLKHVQQAGRLLRPNAKNINVVVDCGKDLSH